MHIAKKLPNDIPTKMFTPDINNVRCDTCANIKGSSSISPPSSCNDVDVDDVCCDGGTKKNWFCAHVEPILVMLNTKGIIQTTGHNANDKWLKIHNVP